MNQYLINIGDPVVHIASEKKAVVIEKHVTEDKVTVSYNFGKQAKIDCCCLQHVDYGKSNGGSMLMEFYAKINILGNRFIHFDWERKRETDLYGFPTRYKMDLLEEYERFEMEDGKRHKVNVIISDNLENIIYFSDVSVCSDEDREDEEDSGNSEEIDDVVGDVVGEAMGDGFIKSDYTSVSREKAIELLYTNVVYNLFDDTQSLQSAFNDLSATSMKSIWRSYSKKVHLKACEDYLIRYKIISSGE